MRGALLEAGDVAAAQNLDPDQGEKLQEAVTHALDTDTLLDSSSSVNSVRSVPLPLPSHANTSLAPALMPSASAVSLPVRLAADSTASLDLFYVDPSIEETPFATEANGPGVEGVGTLQEIVPRRLFLGPHLVPDELAQLKLLTAEHKHEQARFWIRALERGAEGKRLTIKAPQPHKEAEQQVHFHWKGTSYEIGADLRAAIEQARAAKLNQSAASLAPEDADVQSAPSQSVAASSIYVDAQEYDYCFEPMTTLIDSRSLGGRDTPLAPSSLVSLLNHQDTTDTNTAANSQPSRRTPLSVQGSSSLSPEVRQSARSVPVPSPRIDDSMPEVTHRLLRRISAVPSETQSEPEQEQLAQLSTHIDPIRRPALKTSASEATASVLNRNVRFHPHKEPLAILRSDSPVAIDSPAPPTAVLAREMPSEIKPSGPASRYAEANAIRRQDRMLIRVGWTPREDMPVTYTEAHVRTLPVRYERWTEAALVMRKHKLEIYGVLCCSSQPELY